MTTHRFAIAVISPAIEPRGDGSRRPGAQTRYRAATSCQTPKGHSRENEADRDGAPALKIAAAVD